MFWGIWLQGVGKAFGKFSEGFWKVVGRFWGGLGEMFGVFWKVSSLIFPSKSHGRLWALPPAASHF